MGRSSTLLALLLVAAGCGGGSLDPPPIHPGSVQLEWSIDRSTRPADCAAHDAASLRFTLYDASGALAGEWTQDCTTFSTLVPGVAPDDYLGRAQLLDASGRPRTLPADVGLVNVVGGETVRVPVDFAVTLFE